MGDETPITYEYAFVVVLARDHDGQGLLAYNLMGGGGETMDCTASDKCPILAKSSNKANASALSLTI